MLIPDQITNVSTLTQPIMYERGCLTGIFPGNFENLCT